MRNTKVVCYSIPEDVAEAAASYAKEHYTTASKVATLALAMFLKEIKYNG